ncbi:MAG: SDR family NAD(P)-dependent oxidoreductase [Nannocystaceae bacterium]
MESTKQRIVVIGMGAGIARAVARRFGREGFAVAMIARDEGRLAAYVEEFAREGIDATYASADAGDEGSLRAALRSLRERDGDPDVLVYNAAAIRMVDILEQGVDELVADFRVNVAGALAAAQEVAPAMRAAGRGTILLTGGGFALMPNPRFGSLAIGKAGLRNLAHSLAQALAPAGVHVATVTVCGMVRDDDPKYNPTTIAEHYWALHAQPPGAFEVELKH